VSAFGTVRLAVPTVVGQISPKTRPDMARGKASSGLKGGSI